METEFWGVELKHGEPLKVSPGYGRVLHLSQASLGEHKNEKGKESVSIFVNVDGKKLVLGTLITNKLPQHQFDILLDRDFELSHDWKSGSVYFYGYKASNSSGEDESLEGESDESESEEDLPINLANNGKPESNSKDEKPESKPKQEKSEPNPQQVKPESKAEQEKHESKAQQESFELKAEQEKPADAERSNTPNKGPDAGRDSMKILEAYKNVTPEEEDESSYEDLMSEHDEDNYQVETSKKRPVESGTKKTVPRKKAKVTPRETGYTHEEDKHICSVYIDISQDPTIGICQRAKQLWSRVTEQYNDSKPNTITTTRNQISLMCRFNKIKASVRQLNGCVRQIELMNQSGASNEDIMNQAKELFRQQSKDCSEFKFDHVWHMMKDYINVGSTMQRQTNLSSSQSDASVPEFPMSYSPGLSSFNINSSDENEGGSSSSRRPEGVKKSKLKRKKKDNITNAIDVLQQSQKRIEELLNNSNELQQKAVDGLLLKREYKILMINLETISDPVRREFIRGEQYKIMEKRSRQSEAGNTFNVFGSYFQNLGGSGAGLPGGNEPAPLPGNDAAKSPADNLNKQMAKSEKPYPCKICNKSFTTEQGVESHTKAKHGDGK